LYPNIKKKIKIKKKKKKKESLVYKANL
jgi:hypothetical protein